MKSLVDQWKERCAQVRADEEKPGIVEVVPIVKLYNIVKRSTSGKLNKVVGIGFTHKEAEEWLLRKVNRAIEKDSAIIFYDIVDQENNQALDPLWNPRPFFIGEAI